MSGGDLKELFDKYVSGQATSEEQDRLFQMVLDPQNQESLDVLMRNFILTSGNEEQLSEASFQSILNAIVNETPVHRVHFIRKWGWAAACALLLACAGTWFLGTHQKASRPNIMATIAPGKEGAILTLANGKQIVLDSLGNGTVATQNGVRIVLGNGKLSYDPTGNSAGEMEYNIMSTPKGRQIHMELSDGTDVWLNAASAIRFPTVFAGKERVVEVTGEVYFEVAANAAKPFLVNVNKRMKIDVLGTHFNVSAYENEESLNTTLLQGSVRITGAGKSVLLKPGEQAQVADNLSIVHQADTDKIIAWKNGLFNFEGMHLREVMRQLERWYNIEVVYENNVPDIEFYGKLKRDLSLEELFVTLKDLDIHFRIDGRKLTIFP